jgi:(E)-4-hydroxy-3-methyl-but-2-enyl pyrophosphate reductase
MIVVRADTLGLCSGVRRALRLVEEALAENPGAPLYTLGPLIHNSRVVRELEGRGVRVVEDLSEVQAGIVVIRTHGIGPEQMRECGRPGVRCIDATCPKVRRIHETVAAFDAKGYSVIVVGDPAHGEVRGIRGHARRTEVVASSAEAEAVPVCALTLVVSQTTFPRDAYTVICETLKKRKPDIVVVNTSCAATETRRESLLRLARNVDALLVIGGMQSANTRWLHEAALATGKPAWRIEGASDLPEGIGSFSRVGISAGASTPDAIIDEVETALLLSNPSSRRP